MRQKKKQKTHKSAEKIKNLEETNNCNIKKNTCNKTKNINETI